MKIVLCFLLCALAHLAVGEEAPAQPAWIRELQPVVGRPWLPMPSGTASYQFTWSGFRAAEAELTFSRENRQVARLQARGRTAGAARAIFRLDTTALYLSDLAARRPIRARMLENYSRRTVVGGLEFDSDEVVYSRGRREPKKIPRDLLQRRSLDRQDIRKLTGAKGRRFKFPGMVDLQSALFYLRAQPLRPGDTLHFVLFHGTAPYRVTIKAKEREQITVPAGTYRAIPFTIQLEWIDKKHDLRPHRNFRSATAWFSDDADRLLLKVESEIFIGAITGELISFTPEKP